MANDIEALRAELFDSIRKVKDGSLDVAKARAISETAQVIINSAKLELEFVKENAGNGTGFVPEILPRAGQPRLVKGSAASGSK